MAEAASHDFDDGAVMAMTTSFPPHSCARSPPHPSLKRKGTTRSSPCCDGAFERAAAAAVAAAADLGALPTPPTSGTASPFAGVFGGTMRPGGSLPAASNEDMDSVAAALEIPELVRSQFGRERGGERGTKRGCFVLSFGTFSSPLAPQSASLLALLFSLFIPFLSPPRPFFFPLPKKKNNNRHTTPRPSRPGSRLR